MTVMIGDMEEMAVALIVLFVRIGIVLYFSMYLSAGLARALSPQIVTMINWGDAFKCGAVKGTIGLAPGGC